MKVTKMSAVLCVWVAGCLNGTFSVAALSPNVWVDGTLPGAGEAIGPCGGEIPWPFATLNQKAELADGEHYALNGTIIFTEGLPYFLVDFRAHPWLASERRTARPFYSLMGVVGFWKRYEGKYVQVVGEAQGVIAQDAGTRRFFYEIGLVVANEPIITEPVYLDRKSP